MRYSVGSQILIHSARRVINGRRAYDVMQVTAINPKTGSAIGMRMTKPERYMAWTPIAGGSWLVLQEGLTEHWEKKFEDAKMVALYPQILDRMAAIDRHGRKTSRPVCGTPDKAPH